MKAEEYLIQKGIDFITKGNELQFNCPINGCDEGKTPKMSRCYMNAENGVFNCFRCGEKGNLITLAKHFGDDPAKLGLFSEMEPIGKIVKIKTKEITEKLSPNDVERWHQAIPENIREWLEKDRCLAPEIIASAKLGWDGQRVVIPIADAKGIWLFAKRRAPPNSDIEPKYLYPSGAKAALYNSRYLQGASTIVICEGELDSLILLSKGIPAVTSTGGAGTFEEAWIDLFKDVETIFIVYDNDDAGKKGALKVGKLLPRAKIAKLPPEVGDKGDVTDFFVKLNKTPDDFFTLLKNGKSAEEIEEQGERYQSLPRPDKETSIIDWRSVVKENFPECLMASEVGLSVISQLLINDVRNPFGLVYVDVPSAGKTITLNFFSHLDELVYMTDSFTPASLVSHASNRSKEDLEKIDLLPRIRFKVVGVRDLAPMFAERQENLLKNLGVLTRVFDGEGYESDSGVHGKRGYRGDYTFMMLAGSTPIAPRVWKFMGNLGSRLFFLNMNVPDKSRDELADLLISEDFKRKETECRQATRNLSLTVWAENPGGVIWNKPSDPRELLKIISSCAKLLANLRGTLNVWSPEEEGGDKQHTNVVIEKPMRINQLLYNLARGHALVCGRKQLTEEDMWPIIEVTFNSAQYNRIKLFDCLIENKGTINTKLAEWAINCSDTTAGKEIETLRILGIVDVKNEETITPGRPEKIVTIKSEFDWFCSDDCDRLRKMRP